MYALMVVAGGFATDWSPAGGITAGDSMSYDTSSLSTGDRVRVVWMGNNGDTVTLAAFDIPRTSSATSVRVALWPVSVATVLREATSPRAPATGTDTQTT